MEGRDPLVEVWRGMSLRSGQSESMMANYLAKDQVIMYRMNSKWPFKQ